MIQTSYIANILSQLEAAMEEGEFVELENSRIELKDLSGGSQWESLKETICAFLNSDGGYVICGVRERDKAYHFTGFNRNNESKLLDLHHKTFSNDDGIGQDVSDSIHFEYYPFLTGEVVVIGVESLPQDKKFIKYKNEYWERKLTQDRKIAASKIQQQKEYKAEIVYAKELTIVPKASWSDLSLDKINQYIVLLNQEIRKEKLKASLEMAQSFLTRQHFVQGEQVTTLGMLVCGEDPFSFLGNRAAVDCYYDTKTDIGRDSKSLRDDVLNLMDDTFRYVWGHIKVGRTVEGGGREKPEYPEDLIRESINNALAHRDYTLDIFVTVKVEPNRWVEIKNPGSFKAKIKLLHTETDIPIRRLIAGIPESKNPKLASVLKIFDKIESQGRGMAALLNAALANLIDLPYYELGEDTIRLVIPTGRLVDEAVETWLAGFERYITYKLLAKLTAEHQAVLAYFYKSERLNRQNRYTILLSESNNHFGVIDELEQAGLVVKHPASTELGAVYVLDRVLAQTDFRRELVDLVGMEYVDYTDVAKHILNMVYLFSKYNEQALKASDLTPYVYREKYGREIIGRTYETLGRQVRKQCNEFAKGGILVKDDKSAYRLNFEFEPPVKLL